MILPSFSPLRSIHVYFSSSDLLFPFQDLEEARSQQGVYADLYASSSSRVDDLSQSLREAKDKRVADMDSLLSQAHARYTFLSQLNDARSFRLGWEDCAKDPDSRVYKGGPGEFDRSLGIEENNYDPDPYIQSRDLRIDFIDEEEGDAGEADEAGTSGVQEARVSASDPDPALPEAASPVLHPVLPSGEGPSSSAAGAAPLE